MPDVAAQRRQDGQQAAGWVLTVHGHWYVANAPDSLLPGRILIGGDTLRPGPSSSGPQAITVVLRDGNTIRRDCRGPAAADCATPIIVRRAAEGSVWDRILAPLMSHLAQNRGRIASLVSRGGDADNPLAEAILTTHGNGTDPTAALAGLPAGLYEFAVIPLLADSTGVSRSAHFQRLAYTWNPAAPEALRIDAESGLFELREMDSGHEAWVLLCAGARCAELQGEFDTAATLARAWGADLPADDRRLFLRSMLEMLSRRTRA